MELPDVLQVEPVGESLLDFAVFARVLDQFPGLRELRLEGAGEPLRHPRLLDMVAYAAGRGVDVVLVSDCSLMTPELARSLPACGAVSLQVRLDAAERRAYEGLRPGARFRDALRGARLAARAWADRASPLRLSLLAEAVPGSLGELPALPRLARRLGIPVVFVRQPDESLLRWAGPGLVELAFDAATRAAAAEGVVLRLPQILGLTHPPGSAGETRCDWPWRRACLGSDGGALPCGMPSSGGGPLGDLSSDPAFEVWNGTAFAAFRAALGSAAPPSACRSCPVYRGTF